MKWWRGRLQPVSTSLHPCPPVDATKYGIGTALACDENGDPALTVHLDGCQ